MSLAICFQQEVPNATLFIYFRFLLQFLIPKYVGTTLSVQEESCIKTLFLRMICRQKGAVRNVRRTFTVCYSQRFVTERDMTVGGGRSKSLTFGVA